MKRKDQEAGNPDFGREEEAWRLLIDVWSGMRESFIKKKTNKLCEQKRAFESEKREN